MATNAPSDQRRLHETEYRTWAQICLDKHGTPWPIAEENLSATSDEVLLAAIKTLKMLGRTPHEG
jgi:hypothetical protein